MGAAGASSKARAALAWAGALVLAACASLTPPGALAPPPADAPPAAPQPSAESAALASHYRQVQAELLSRGLLRTDGGESDAPFTAEILAQNFLKIAFYEELDRNLGGGIRRQAPIRLTRWATPVRVALRFGVSLAPDQRAVHTARIRSYLARLAALTGLEIGLADKGANYAIFIADVDERRALGPAIRAILPELTDPQLAQMTEMDRNTYCQVITENDPVTATYGGAVVVIPAEHPDLMFMMCLNEEVAQSLGLPNDNGLVRPSIFNDDQEFALLTRQDEWMLKMLYDPALTPGMDEGQARAIVQTLAAQAMGGGS